MKITIVSSSTRTGRLSPRVALALKVAIEKTDNSAQIIDLSEINLPIFEERLAYLDSPNDGLKAVSDTLQASDGFIFLTPEYNGSISSGMKNFIDVFAKDPFNGKPIGVATASTGAMGGIRAAYQLQQIILSIFGYPIPQMLTVGNMDKVLDENGVVLEASFQKRLDGFLEAYLEFVRKIAS